MFYHLQVYTSCAIRSYKPQGTSWLKMELHGCFSCFCLSVSLNKNMLFLLTPNPVMSSSQTNRRNLLFIFTVSFLLRIFLKKIFSLYKICHIISSRYMRMNDMNIQTLGIKFPELSKELDNYIHMHKKNKTQRNIPVERKY